MAVICFSFILVRELRLFTRSGREGICKVDSDGKFNVTCKKARILKADTALYPVNTQKRSKGVQKKGHSVQIQQRKHCCCCCHSTINGNSACRHLRVSDLFRCFFAYSSKCVKWNCRRKSCKCLHSTLHT